MEIITSFDIIVQITNEMIYDKEFFELLTNYFEKKENLKIEVHLTIVEKLYHIIFLMLRISEFTICNYIVEGKIGITISIDFPLKSIYDVQIFNDIKETYNDILMFEEIKKHYVQKIIYFDIIMQKYYTDSLSDELKNIMIDFASKKKDEDIIHKIKKILK